MKIKDNYDMFVIRDRNYDAWFDEFADDRGLIHKHGNYFVEVGFRPTEFYVNCAGVSSEVIEKIGDHICDAKDKSKNIYDEIELDNVIVDGDWDDYEFDHFIIRQIISDELFNEIYTVLESAGLEFQCGYFGEGKTLLVEVDFWDYIEF